MHYLVTERRAAPLKVVPEKNTAVRLFELIGKRTVTRALAATSSGSVRLVQHTVKKGLLPLGLEKVDVITGVISETLHES